MVSHALQAAARPPHARLQISVIVCAWNEAATIGPCLASLLAQRRPPDQIIVVDNASTDGTGDRAAAFPGVQVVREPRKGLTRAREAGRLAATGDIIACLDADCRAPDDWLVRIERRFLRSSIIALTGPFRYYDWDVPGRLALRVYDTVAAPLAQFIVRDVLDLGALLYGGNFAVRRDALAAIGGFDTGIEFHGEDTNLGRRLHRVGRVVLARECTMCTSARRFHAMGRGAVLRLYARNFWHELLWHRPADTAHVDVRR